MLTLEFCVIILIQTFKNMINEEEDLITPEIIALTGNVEINLLPEKSKKIYEQTYRRFTNYKLLKKIDSLAENVLVAYFVKLSENVKSSTLWAIYSMLKATINAYDNVDISKYLKLKAFLKKKSDGYQAKKSRILRREHVEKFLFEAPDKKFLSRKVALIFGIAGACRSQELLQLKVSDIEEMKDKLLITLPDTKTKKKRFFLVTEHLDIYRKYVAARPPLMESQRFFYKYTDGKPYKQLIGIHTFGKMPQEIAIFLKLPKVEAYTGHCFRRTSAILFENSGGNIMTLRGEDGGQSPTVSKGYDEDPLQIKSELNGSSFPSCSSSNTNCLPSFSTSGQDDENSTDLENTVCFNKVSGGEGFVIKNCQNLTVNIINNK